MKSEDQEDPTIFSSIRSSSVYPCLLHTYPIHFSKIFKFGAILPIWIHNSLSLSFSVWYTEQNQAILLHELHWQRMQEEGVVQLAPRLEVARGIGRQDSWQGMRRDNKVAESNHCREGLPLPSKQTKIHPAGLVSPFVPVVYCYFVSVKLLCYSTQGGNDLTLWGWSYFGQDSFVSQLSYFLQLLSVTSSLYPSLSPKLQQ